MRLLLFLLFSAIYVGAHAQRKTIIVAQDGSGNYRSIKEAFDAVPKQNKLAVTIFVKRGIYKEKLLLDSSKNKVRLVGEDHFKTIITNDDHTGKVASNGDTINTYTSQTFMIRANEFTAENISFENNSGATAGQAVAVQAYGDKLVFRNCRFLGFQDVLFTSNPASRQYYENCYIEGTTDFIFGPSTVWFEKCQIHSKKNSHVTAASTPQEKAYGYVFNECILTADTALRSVSLGRPWRPYASVTYLHCFIGGHILPEGWNNWKRVENESTARFSEFENFGPGANTARRESWSHQLSEEESKLYTIKKVFPLWQPR